MMSPNQSSSSMNSLSLGDNNFYGPIPESISGLVNLSWLDLSHNDFIGTISRSMSKLVSLDVLDLSNNKLEGQVPGFLWGVPTWLRLSHNSLSSLEKPLKVIHHNERYMIELGSNSLQGQFPQWVCKFNSLDVLDLSNNHLTGFIPSCLMNSTTTITVINLRNNNFSGFLPDIYKDANILQSLDVSGNKLVGKLPRSLINCSNLEFLNLRGNKIKDTFPSWLRTLGSLRILLLGSNAFYGPIYSSTFAYSRFPSLRIIDISHNNFTGTLPQDYFANLLEMSSVTQEADLVDSMYQGRYITNFQLGRNYEDSMVMIYKGVEIEFARILNAFKAIDFSGNKFRGSIPKSIGMLKGLRLLNLSGNAFTGSIPSTLANITNLEELDLSRNKLSGHIPPDLDNLSFNHW